MYDKSTDWKQDKARFGPQSKQVCVEMILRSFMFVWGVDFSVKITLLVDNNAR